MRWSRRLEAKFNIPQLEIGSWESYCLEQLVKYPACQDSTQTLITLFKPAIRERFKRNVADWLRHLKEILRKLKKQDRMYSRNIEEFIQQIERAIIEWENVDRISKLIEKIAQTPDLRSRFDSSELRKIQKYLIPARMQAHREASELMIIAEASYEKGYSDNEDMFESNSVRLFHRTYTTSQSRRFKAKYFDALDKGGKVRKEAFRVFKGLGLKPPEAQELLYVLSNGLLMMTPAAVRTQLNRTLV